MVKKSRHEISQQGFRMITTKRKVHNNQVQKVTLSRHDAFGRAYTPTERERERRGRYCGHMINTLASEPYPPTTILTLVIQRIGHEMIEI